MTVNRESFLNSLSAVYDASPSASATSGEIHGPLVSGVLLSAGQKTGMCVMWLIVCICRVLAAFPW